MGEDTFLAAKVAFFRRMENENCVEFNFRMGTVIFSFF